MFTLHQMLFAALAQDQVDAAIRAVAVGLRDDKALAAKGFAGQLFELLPTDALDRFAGTRGADEVVQQLTTFDTGEHRANRAEDKSSGHQELQDQGEASPHLPGNRWGELLGVGNGRRRADGDGVEVQPGSQCDQQAKPPGQAGGDGDKVFEGGGFGTTGHP